MKVWFFHDCKFNVYKNRYFASGGLNDERLKFYTDIFEEINIVARREIVKDVKGLMEIKNKRVKFDLFNKENYIIMLLKNKKKLERIIKESDYCIIRVPSIIGILALKISKKYKKNILIEVVGCPYDSLSNGHGVIGKILALLEYIIMKYYIYGEKRVIYVTNKFLQMRYPTRGLQLACSDVVINDIREENLIERLNKIENNKRKIIIGTVGAVNIKYKGQQYVIKAIAELKKLGYKFEYQIVGGGDNSFLKKVAKKYNIEEEIKFLGSLTHNDVFKFMKNIDVYIQPSNVEGLCRSLIEAMSMGCPCIASDAGGNLELINDEYIFKKKIIKDLQNKIITIIDKRNMKKCAKINFEKAKEYSTDKLEEKRKKFYKEFLEND